MKGPEARYVDYLKQGEFRLPRNAKSGKFSFYPRVTLSSEEDNAVDWVQVDGVGRVYSTTDNVTREGVKNIAIVELDEGVRMLSRVECPRTVVIGDRVKARIEYEDGEPFIVFSVLGGE